MVFGAESFVEIPGLGEIKPYQIYENLYDPISEAITFLPKIGAAATLGRCGADLQNEIAKKTWRSPYAYDLLTRLQREALAQYSEILHEHNQALPVLS
jgi:hypothetical protein